MRQRTSSQHFVADNDAARRVYHFLVGSHRAAERDAGGCCRAMGVVWEGPCEVPS
jgi:hypothetical protein